MIQTIYLGIDYGRQNIGLSLSQSGFAEPLMFLPNTPRIFELLKKICQKHQVQHIIVGITQGSLSDEITSFATQVKTQTGLPVTLHDEALSTQETKKHLKHKSKSFRAQPQDAFQAAFILQDYLDFTAAQSNNS